MCAKNTRGVSTNLNQHTRLVVRICCEGLRLLCGDGRITLDESSENTTSSLDSERQRSNVEKKQVLNLLVLVATQNSCLYS